MDPVVPDSDPDPQHWLPNTQAAFNTKATGSYSVHDSSRTVCQACRSLRFTLLKHLIKETGSQDRTEIF